MSMLEGPDEDERFSPELMMLRLPSSVLISFCLTHSRDLFGSSQKKDLINVNIYLLNDTKVWNVIHSVSDKDNHYAQSS